MLTKTNMENQNNQKIGNDMKFEQQIHVPIMNWLSVGFSKPKHPLQNVRLM